MMISADVFCKNLIAASSVFWIISISYSYEKVAISHNSIRCGYSVFRLPDHAADKAQALAWQPVWRWQSNASDAYSHSNAKPYS